MGLFLQLDGSTVFIDSLTRNIRGTTLERPDHFGVTANTKFLIDSGKTVAFSVHRSPADRADAEFTVIVSGRLIRAKQ